MSVDAVRAAVSELMPQARADLTELVSLRSVAEPTHPARDECSAAARWVVDAFAEAGLDDVEMSLTSDGSAAVHGHAQAPAGAPTVLLYSHYDIQPSGEEQLWRSPPFELTERGGRWYGRGSADCKGNIVAHLTALRALRRVDGGFTCGVKLICEGSEEQGTGGLETFVAENADLLRADTILVCDVGNSAVGVPTLTTSLRGMVIVDVTVRGLAGPAHSGVFGGSAPDALAGLLVMLASLWDEHGDVAVDALATGQRWAGSDYPADRLRADADVLSGVDLLGTGSVSDALWARPAATVLGVDVPSVSAAEFAVQAEATARISLRVPPGTHAAAAQDALVAHLRSRVPWNLRCELARAMADDPFVGSLAGAGHESLRVAMEQAYGRPLTTQGQGASIPLCGVLAETYPEAEIFLIGVEEPMCSIHAPNESVDPAEIERLALAEALFLQRYATAAR